MSDPQDIELADLARLRQDCYHLLGDLFLYPDEERHADLASTAQAVTSSTLLAAFPFYGPFQRLLGALSDLSSELNHDLQTAFFCLFESHPELPRCRPYESFYLDPYGKSAGAIMADLEGEYASAGFALSPSPRELPDHISVQFGFLSFLCGREAEAWESESIEDGVRLVEREGMFLRDHPARWLPRFAGQVNAMAEGSLYGAASHAACALLEHDQDFLAALRENLNAAQCPASTSASGRKSDRYGAA